MKRLARYPRSATLRRLPLVLVSLALLIVIAAACGGSGSATDPSVQPTATDTPYERELFNVADDGSRSLESALKLFAIVFGPLPGVDAPTDNTGATSGSLALHDILVHEAELTEEQRAAVAAYLATPADAVTFTMQEADESEPPSSKSLPTGANNGASDALVLAMNNPADGGEGLSPGSLNAAPPSAALVAATKRAGRQAHLTIVQYMGRDIPEPIDFVVGPPSAKSLAAAVGHFDGETYLGCTVMLFHPDSDTTFNSIANSLAHEVFHCFEYSLMKGRSNFLAAKAWLIEGAAEWVGNVLGGADSSTVERWENYLNLHGRPLFVRDYDAMGFYAHLVDIGVSPWGVFPKMFANPGNVAAFTASGAAGDRFLDSWASSYYRMPELGKDWNADGPGITAVPPDHTFGQLPVGNGDTAQFSAPAYTIATYVLDSSADVVTVQTSGHVRLNDRSLDTTNLKQAAFCTKFGGGCTCPDGNPPPVTLTPLQNPSFLAVTGGMAGTTGSATGISLEELCKKPTPEPNAVMVHLDRQEQSYNKCNQEECQSQELEDSLDYTLHAGRVFELISCDGVFGTWKGVMRQGGFEERRHGTGHLYYELGFSDFPIEFTVAADGPSGSANTTSTGSYLILAFNPEQFVEPGSIPVPFYDPDMPHHDDGVPGTESAPTTFTIAATVTTAKMTVIATNELGYSNPFYDQFRDMTIEPAPDGSCP